MRFLLTISSVLAWLTLGTPVSGQERTDCIAREPITAIPLPTTLLADSSPSWTEPTTVGGSPTLATSRLKPNVPEALPQGTTASTSFVASFDPATPRAGVEADSPLCQAKQDPPQAWGFVAFVGYDAWRGVADDSWENNGISAGFNSGMRLGSLSDQMGIGLQAGASIGVFNWSGTDYRPSNRTEAQTQGFITYGLFRKSPGSNWTASVVQDWMLNDNYGVYSQNPRMSQMRGQMAYAWNEWNEIGLWGAWRVIGDNAAVPNIGWTTWRPIDQANLYWHHKWTKGGADTTIWIGLPELDRLGGGGSLGEYLAGASATVPLNDWFALYTLVTYMHPSASAGPAGSEEDAWNFTVGVSLYYGGGARSDTVGGQCWMPTVPVANNGYFLVDTNHH